MTREPPSTTTYAKGTISPTQSMLNIVYEMEWIALRAAEREPRSVVLIAQSQLYKCAASLFPGDYLFRFVASKGVLLRNHVIFNCR